MIFVPYNRDEAIAYARRWALSRNPEFYDYEGIGGDCTNFVSQCVYAGTGVMNYTPTYGWYYIDSNNKSPSWTGVDFFYSFMVNNRSVGPYGVETRLINIVPGDIIQLGNSNGMYYHSLILTRIETDYFGRRYYICSHSEDSLDRDLFTYNFAKLRCIHIIGARED